MHGRLKTRSTAEQQELKRKEREKKLKLYRVCIGRVFEKHAKEEYDEELLEATGQLLSSNPDIYTLWNYRRETLIYLKENWSTDEFQNMMQGELRLTQQCLQVNPKSYGGWHHRVWVMDHMPIPNWNLELSLCNKYLDIDERNFHVWDHRRFVVSRAKVPAKDELAYSTSKISTNFSNYSSWHYRSRLLPLVYPDPQGNLPIREDQHKNELELVHNATFTDPNDQSAWFYQRWLLGCAKQVVAIVGAMVRNGSSSVALTQSITLSAGHWELELLINEENVTGTWASSKNHQSHVWTFCPAGHLFHDDMSSAIVVLRKDSQEVDRLSLKVVNGQAFSRRSAQFSVGFSEGLTSVMEEELDSFEQLLEMEPDSKWTLLTSVLLMQAIDRHKYKEQILQKLEQLLQIDTFRTGYYKDLRSRLVMEYAINTMEESLSSTIFPREINLRNLNLTSFYHGCQLSLLCHVDLGSNRLFRSLSQLHTLQCCSWLSLDDNSIENLQDFPKLTALQTLSLAQNKIKFLNDINSLVNCQKLSSLNLKGNPVDCDVLLQDSVRKMFPLIIELSGQRLSISMPQDSPVITHAVHKE